MSGVPGDEAGLWARSLDGDADAFAALFDLHRDRVFGQAARLLEGRHEAEDVAASAFLELWRRRGDVRLVGGSVLPWLLVTTSNLARNSVRARRHYRSFLARLPREERAADAGSVAVDGSVLGIDPGLRSALRSLPEQDLHLLTLVVFEDLSLAEAAAVLHITESAAKTRLHRVRHRLRSQLGDLDTPSTTQGGQR
ncbi:MAG TPA: sigma-70 family RNA polymerase sigma factor [Candidatus Limnocylindrales bacterium]|nr:sigma-70 family RNA polymerase sigma factor [Candidatus Limnocylindrales bacterium]